MGFCRLMEPSPPICKTRPAKTWTTNPKIQFQQGFTHHLPRTNHICYDLSPEFELKDPHFLASKQPSIELIFFVRLHLISCVVFSLEKKRTNFTPMEFHPKNTSTLKGFVWFKRLQEGSRPTRDQPAEGAFGIAWPCHICRAVLLVLEGWKVTLLRWTESHLLRFDKIEWME